MNKIILFAMISSFSISVAFAKPIMISASTEDGLYTQVICPSLVNALKNNGVEAKCLISSGSGQNFERVVKGEVTAGLMQRDVLFALTKKDNKAEYENYIALGSLTPEAIWMVALGKGGVNFESFTKSYAKNSAPKTPLVIGVAGDSKSGSSLTMMQTIAINIPSLKQNIEAGYVRLKLLGKIPPNVAYHKLGNGLDAVMFVQMPDMNNIRIKNVVDSKGKYVFLDISSPQLTQLHFSSQRIYREADIMIHSSSYGNRLENAWGALMGGDTKNTGGGKSVHTLVTETTLFINPEKVSPNVMTALSNVSNLPDLLPNDSVAGTLSLWWQNVKKASEELTRD